MPRRPIVHFLFAEIAFNRDSPQQRWLVADLAAVNRKLTPFVVVTMHRPLYIAAPPTDSGE